MEPGDKAKWKITIQNTGSAPLVITHVTSSCDCTEPKWTERPIKPGKHGKISLEYDTYIKGKFNKWALIYTNRNLRPVKVYLRGGSFRTIAIFRKIESRIYNTAN
jgi:uncharacterized membrane protein